MPQRRDRPGGGGALRTALLALTLLLALSAGAVLMAPAVRRISRRGLPAPPRPGDASAGRYLTVREVVPPHGLRLDDGTVVEPAGVRLPDESREAEASAVAARVEALVEAAAGRVYVEPEPGDDGDGASAGPRRASVWLPPEGAAGEDWFPHERMRLLGATLVRDGLLRVDRDAAYVYRNELLMQEHEARRHGRGLWASEAD